MWPFTKPDRRLYQLPISHYCEKTRWHLDHKRLDYEVIDLLPGAHRLLAPRAPGHRGTLPVLVDGDEVIGDSTRIALHLEERYPARPLLPADPAQRARVLELEELFDEGAGPHVRRWAYGTAMRTPGGAARLMFSSYPARWRWLAPLMARPIERGLRRMYRIDDASIELSREKILEAAGHLERETESDPRRYLVGDALTLADVAAAALLGALVAPAGSPYFGMPMPAELRDFGAALAARPAGAWVAERYRVDRRPA